MGGGVLALLLSSPGAQSSERSLQAFQAVCFLESNLLESNPFLRGGLPLLWFKVGPPIYIYLSWCLGPARGSFIFVSRRGPLGRSGVERLEPGWFSWATGSLGAVPSSVSQGRLPTWPVAWRSSPILSARTCSSVRSIAARPSGMASV